MSETERGRRYRRLHPERVRATQMSWKRRSKFGITPERYAEMCAAQGGRCAACGLPERRLRIDGTTRALVIDHDHKTGAVRSLLCSRCNSALHVLEDSELYASLSAYLGRF